MVGFLLLKEYSFQTKAVVFQCYKIDNLEMHTVNNAK